MSVWYDILNLLGLFSVLFGLNNVHQFDGPRVANKDGHGLILEEN
jgi:hypothetical protein